MCFLDLHREEGPYQVCYQAFYKACDNQMCVGALNKVELDIPSVKTYLST